MENKILSKTIFMGNGILTKNRFVEEWNFNEGRFVVLVSSFIQTESD